MFLYGYKLMPVGFEPTPASAFSRLLSLQTFGRILPSAVLANTPRNLSKFIAVPLEQSCTICKHTAGYAPNVLNAIRV
jgi:hypothetical protein